jgi:hypothetical protein
LRGKVVPLQLIAKLNKLLLKPGSDVLTLEAVLMSTRQPSTIQRMMGAPADLSC